ncbi:MAG: hypothetical protein DRN68_07840, partial [Thaumarchaeota archaeon]
MLIIAYMDLLALLKTPYYVPVSGDPTQATVTWALGSAAIDASITALLAVIAALSIKKNSSKILVAALAAAILATTPLKPEAAAATSVGLA